MKIVDVSAFYAPNGGGVRTYAERKLVALPRAGHEIVIVAPGPVTRTEVRGPAARIRWLRSPKFPLDRNYRYFNDRAALHAVLDDEDPDVVEASSPWRSAAMVGQWPGRAVRALVAHADPLAAFAYRWFEDVADRATIDRQFDWYWRHLRRLDARFDVVVSASRSLTERLRAGGLAKVQTNPMGVEPGVFSPTWRDSARRERLLADCGLGPEATLLLGVGRHAPEKRWRMVVRAVVRASASTPIGLILVGDGHGRAGLERACRDKPIVRILPRVSDRHELACLMASADALIHGCDAETFCLVAAEAQASGLPMIVPDRGGAADFGRASGGWLYRAGDVAAAAAAIRAACARTGDRPHGIVARSMDDHFTDLMALYRRQLAVRHAA